MRLINNITTDSRQQFTLITESGEEVSFLLYYVPTQQQWAFNLSIGNLTINGATIGVAPNLLRNYRNLIDFGLMCISSDGYDPYYINDFVASTPNSSPRIQLFLLNQTDVNNIEKTYFT